MLDWGDNHTTGFRICTVGFEYLKPEHLVSLILNRNVAALCLFTHQIEYIDCRAFEIGLKRSPFRALSQIREVGCRPEMRVERGVLHEIRNDGEAEWDGSRFDRAK